MFLLLAFILLGHECQDLLSPCDEMQANTGGEGGWGGRGGGELFLPDRLPGMKTYSKVCCERVVEYSLTSQCSLTFSKHIEIESAHYVCRIPSQGIMSLQVPTLIVFQP